MCPTGSSSIAGTKIGPSKAYSESSVAKTNAVLSPKSRRGVCRYVKYKKRRMGLEDKKYKRPIPKKNNEHERGAGEKGGVRLYIYHAMQLLVIFAQEKKKGGMKDG